MVNIKVAVRIRPMSNREKCQGDTNIVTISDKCILVTNPKVPEKGDAIDSRLRVRQFAVDYCYDPVHPELSTQEAVFKEVGNEVIGHMFAGYNACVLAYGHSASGKTYTMMGENRNPGLTPRICSELCKRMRASPDVPYHVSVSADMRTSHTAEATTQKARPQTTLNMAINPLLPFLEIYNEKVRDLLIEDEDSPNFSLRVREHPKLGPYVQDLSEHVIETEEDLLYLVNQGNSKRSTAATESNIHSSRSHAVFTIKFKHLSESTAKCSKVHLVDLAGSLQEAQANVSERASAIQSRARLKEGANINKSLVTLGNVISALADNSQSSWGGKSWHPFVPYRDSVLTWLLKDTLGGNSNTIMIATISPGSSCYNDTINTLRYAKRTKRIVNQPLINEDPKIQTIRELREEVLRLKEMLLAFTSQDLGTVDEMSPGIDSGTSCKWQGGQATQSAVGMQTEELDYPFEKWAAAGAVMELTHDLLDHLGTSGRSGNAFLAPKETLISNSKPDILPTTIQEISCSPVFRPHVSEINAENVPGVNRVIADPARLLKLNRQKSASSGNVPRVSCTAFKRRRTVRSISFIWNMLHRSRPDLIKGIGGRPPDTPSTSADPISQSTSDNSLHSSGSAEFRPRPAASLSRTSSIGEASGSSTPKQQVSRPVVRRRENKRAEIVASVTSRLAATVKKPDARQEAILMADKEKLDEDDDELEELKLCKRARMKLFDLNRKLAMTKKVKRTVDSDTQTESFKFTLRVKDKSVATDQQGVPRSQTCSTNTPADPKLFETDPPIVMNQVFLPNNGSFSLECGSNLKLEVLNKNKVDSESQTPPPNMDRATSPRKKDITEDYYSDDSLESERSENLPRYNFGKDRFSSCQELQRYFPPTHQNNFPFYHSHPSLKFISKPIIQDTTPIPKRVSLLEGVRIEKNMSPIARYNISGTNAFYEYDPNRSVPEKIIFSSSVDNKSEPNLPIIYPEYQKELSDEPPSSYEALNSSEEAMNKSAQSTEDHSSSETSSASMSSSIGSSETSSEDFVFVENLNPQNRDLYTIAENSEASCSNRSSPDNSGRNKGEITEICPTKNTGKKIPEESKKKIHWAEIECKRSNKFVNFNYTPSKNSNEDVEELFPSEDSITFVFLGAKQPRTSVLMEIVKRSIMGGSENENLTSKKQGTKTKLMRSVSVDTAMIALSRFSRQQKDEMSRTNSLSNVASEETQVNFDFEPRTGCVENGTQCRIVDKVDATSEIQPIDEGSQCELEKMQRYSVGINTTTDQGTETDAHSEGATQTDIEAFFNETEPQLPRRTTCSVEGDPISQNFLRNEIRQIILGTKENLFPGYLQNEEPVLKRRPSRKTVSWSDLRLKEKKTSETSEDSEANAFPPAFARKVNFPESDENRPHTLPRGKPSMKTLKEFCKQATTILENFNQNQQTDSSDSEREDSPQSKNYSTSTLLLRRNKHLTRIKTVVVKESSVQTEVEKVDSVVQTGGFAASLVGPPVRLPSPNFYRSPREELVAANLTWPRRRGSAAKPPPSPRSRSGSTSNRAPASFRNLPASYLQSQSKTVPLVQIPPMDASCERLKRAIEMDKKRQRDLEQSLLYFSDESSSFKYHSTAVERNGREYNRYQENFNERYCSIENWESQPWELSPRVSTASSPYISHNSFRNEDFKARLMSTNRTSEVLSPVPCVINRVTTSGERRNNNDSSTTDYSLWNICRCSCHSHNGLQKNHCHTCCVPCSSESNRPYKSEPSLSLPTYEWRPFRRGSPLAHLRQLISLRRTIVEAEKVNCKNENIA